MRTTEQMKSFWELAREQSRDGEVFRRRIAAIAALAVAACGFLLAVGLGMLVLVFLAGIVVYVGVVAVIALWPRLMPFCRRVPAGAGTVSVKARVHARALATSLARRSVRVDPQRDAIRLNTAGTRHRRSGRYTEAVECHRHALELLRALGDRRGVALTQSNLALALSHAGDDDWSVGLLEEAAAMLRELGDQEHEARIMANLGATHRRHGRRAQGDNVLELALSKLSPASTAYQAIAAELRRAS
jgi:tetratricopeptide (TPR) repeat protein